MRSTFSVAAARKGWTDRSLTFAPNKVNSPHMARCIMRQYIAPAALVVLSLSSFGAAATPSRRPQASGIRVRGTPLNFQTSASLPALAKLVSRRSSRARVVAMASVEDKPKGGPSIGWDSHKAVDQAPESLVRGVEGNESMRRRFEKACREAQLAICKAVEECDGGATFKADSWIREDGGGGISMVLQNGKVWEKAGCNLSVVYGTMPPEALQAATERGVDRAKGMKPGERVPFFACGLSSVMHPRNPHCPTMHFNYRYFETDGGAWWFGGGMDITPSYLDEDDMKHFHGTLKEVCDKHDSTYYPKFKKWADEYFVIKHRGETRGLGGIFFDDQNDKDPDQHFAFSKDCLAAVPQAYIPIIEKHKNDEFTQKQKDWQQMRRGRYTEFNLVYDRGTVFGLKTGGRIESILMSLPETARWEYNHTPEPGSPEEEIMKAFKSPREWV